MFQVSCAKPAIEVLCVTVETVESRRRFGSLGSNDGCPGLAGSTWPYARTYVAVVGVAKTAAPPVYVFDWLKESRDASMPYLNWWWPRASTKLLSLRTPPTRSSVHDPAKPKPPLK